MSRTKKIIAASLVLIAAAGAVACGHRHHAHNPDRAKKFVSNRVDGVIVIPPSIAEELLALCQNKTESEVFEKLMISRTGNVAKYHPLSQEGRREYEAWVAAGRPMDPWWQPPKA